MMTKLPGHPLAAPNGRIGVHVATLYERIGPGWHPCHWCGASVEWRPVGASRKDRLIPDHLDGDPRNNDPANLVPACTGCNTGRGLPNAIREGELTVTRGRKRVQRLRAERRTCIRCGAEFLHQISTAAPGLYCSKSCARFDQQRANAITDGELFIVPADGRRVRAIERQCAKCGRAFLARPVVVKAGGGRYCSKSCAVRASHATRRSNR